MSEIPSISDMAFGGKKAPPFGKKGNEAKSESKCKDCGKSPCACSKKESASALSYLDKAAMPQGEGYEDGWNKVHEIPRDDSDRMVSMWSQQERVSRVRPH